MSKYQFQNLILTLGRPTKWCYWVWQEMNNPQNLKKNEVFELLFQTGNSLWVLIMESRKFMILIFSFQKHASPILLGIQTFKLNCLLLYPSQNVLLCLSMGLCTDSFGDCVGDR